MGTNKWPVISRQEMMGQKFNLSSAL